MIFDEVSHLHRYPQIPYLQDVIAFLERPDLAGLTSPEIEIRGRDLFVRVMRYIPKPAEENKFEKHRIYGDIQVLLQGQEIMQVCAADDLKPLTEYDVKNDYQFYEVENNISSHEVKTGHFAVFYPGEAHRPSCVSRGHDGENLKLVFKVRMGKA